MSPAARGTLIQTVLLAAAVVALMWIKYRAPHPLQDVVGYGLFAGWTLLVGYFSLRSLLARRRTNDNADLLLLARARSPGWYYAGIVAMGVALCVNAMFLFSFATNFRSFAPRFDAAFRGRSTDDPYLWLGVALVAVLFGSFFTWLAAYQIKLTASLMEYWSLFGGYRSIRIGDIKRAGIRIGRKGNLPPIRLEIVPEADQGKPIVVNLKVFRKSDLDRLYRWLGSKLEHQGTGGDSFRRAF